ncbi:MAG: hypothetical protein DRP97_00655, partial [Candidatus Latescibacterota bacterium]
MRNGSSKRLFQYAIGALLVGLTLWWLVARRADEAKIIADSRFLMDTLVTIKAWGDDPAQVQGLLDAAFGEIERLEGVMSSERRDSEVSRINEGASGAWITMSADVASVLGRALFFSRLSDGACDVTIGPVMRLWGFSTTTPHVPDKDKIAAALDLIGADKIAINEG